MTIKSSLARLLSDDLESFYWIGFILADGYFVDYGSYKVLGIEISKKDEKHLQRFAELVKSKVKYRKRTTNFSKCSEICFVKISNEDIDILMEKFKIKFNKTNFPPNISEWNFNKDQMLALIIGFIDGDGSISNRTNQYGSKSTIISIQCGQEWINFLEMMKIFIVSEIDSKFRGKVRTNCRGHAYFCITKPTVITYLKNFAKLNNLPILERKWDKAKTEDYSSVFGASLSTILSSISETISSTSLEISMDGSSLS